MKKKSQSLTKAQAAAVLAAHYKEMEFIFNNLKLDGLDGLDTTKKSILDNLSSLLREGFGVTEITDQIYSVFSD